VHQERHCLRLGRTKAIAADVQQQEAETRKAPAAATGLVGYPPSRRPLPLVKRKDRLARLLARVPAGIALKSTPTPGANSYSAKPARWGSKGSSRSG
jgi:hypothetical protein